MTDWKYLSLRIVVLPETDPLQHRLMPWHCRGWRAAIALALCAWVLMTGCRLVLDPDDYVAGSGNDGGNGTDGNGADGNEDGGPQNGPDSSPDPVTCGAWRPLYFDGLCDLADSSDLQEWSLQAGEYTLDTSQITLVGPDGTSSPIPGRVTIYPQPRSPNNRQVLLVIVKQLNIERRAVLRAVGERPLFLVSLSQITVHGIIDVSSKVHEPSRNGAGANPGDVCVLTQGSSGRSGQDTFFVGSGGGGGGFGAPGGAGGDVVAVNEYRTPGGSGGQRTELPLAEIRGACNGGNGGSGEVDGNARGGSGGGAIMLAARDRIEIRAGGWIDAGGAGGRGGATSTIAADIYGAGAGGGAGGLIVLDAPQVFVETEMSLAANGGGGGGRAGNFKPGNDGQDGYRQSADTGGPVLMPAGGLAPDGLPGSGGNGGGTPMPAGAAGEEGGFGGAGGGGGGGAGYILIHANTIEAENQNIGTPAVTCLDDTSMQTQCIIQ